MPVIDLSGLNNITSVKAHIDVLHKGADNFQDRLNSSLVRETTHPIWVNTRENPELLISVQVQFLVEIQV